MKENIALLDNDNKQERLVHSRPLRPCIVPQAAELIMGVVKGVSFYVLYEVKTKFSFKT